MKLIGLTLMLSGWLIALAALVMLVELSQRMAFVFAGLALELLGLSLLTRAYTAAQRARR